MKKIIQLFIIIILIGLSYKASSCSITPVITAGGPTTFCYGGSVVLSTDVYVSWLWSTGDTTQSITITTSGTYTVYATDINGCTGTSAATIVIVNPLPVPVITVGGGTFFCQGDSVSLTADTVSAYSWSTGSTSQSIWVNSTGNYSVTVTDSNGCSASVSEIMTMDSLPVVSFTGLPDTVCDYSGDFTLTGSPAGGGFFGTGMNGNIFNPFNSPFGNNVITYYFTDTTDGCYNTATHTVYISPCTGIQVINGNAEGFNVFPNPANDVITISFSSSNNESYVLRLTDMLGRTIKEDLVKSNYGNNTYTIYLRDVAKGIYTIILQKGDNISEGKLIVE
jgi:hypothetical protein